MTRYRSPYGQQMPRRGIGSYSAYDDAQAPGATVEIECKILRETDAAVEIDVGKEKVNPETGEITPYAYWIPKSQIKGRTQSADGATVTLTITEWIACKKGLV